MEVITELFALQAHSKGLEINVIFTEGLPAVLIGDEVRLKQILINLVGNAIKFTNSGEILVLVECDRELSADNLTHFKFSVIDTGIGIAIEDQAKLFQPFSQLEASTNRRFGGTGLGLAISKQLVQLMNGEIGVSSPVSHDGRGTNFWFKLPLLNDFANYQPEQTQNLTNQHILVIDTNANSRLAMNYYLTKFNAIVSEAANYLEAIACLESCDKEGHPIDLVLIDWQLTSLGALSNKVSVGSEHDVVAQIRQQVKFAALPFVIVLRSDHQQLAHQAIAAGFKAHIVKPLKGQRILKAILTALDVSRSTSKAIQETIQKSILEPISQPLTNFNNSSNTPNDDLKKLRVLLAEDNVVNQKITMSYLSQIGCQADLAEDGKQVLQLLPTKNYDIILMDGYATTRAIRQLEAQAEAIDRIMIIAMTANAFKEDRDRCLESGMDDYLSKPIRKKQLQETLEYWVSQKHNLKS
jgi:CheY-like chemotaxis protein